MTNKYANAETLSMEAIQKIKILKMYDYINEKGDEIKAKNYSVAQITRAFQLSNYEIGAYLKNVCNLSQKLETAHVCEILNNIKDRLEIENKKRKPNLSDITSKELINDERFSLIALDESSIYEEDEEENMSEYLRKKEPTVAMALEEKPTFTVNASSREDNLYNESKNANAITPNKIEEADEEFKNFVKSSNSSSDNFTQAFTPPVGDSNIEVINEEDFKRDLIKELKNDELEVEEPSEINLSTSLKPKRKSNKFVILFGGTSLMALALAGTFLMFFGDSNDAIVNTPTMFENNQNINSSTNELEQLAKNNSIISPITADEPKSNNPIAPKEPSVESIAPKIEAPVSTNPIVSNEDILYPNENINKPIINNSANDEKIAEIENKLNTLITLMSKNNSSNSNAQPSIVDNKPLNKEAETVNVDFKNISSISVAMKKFKFNKDGFEYGGKLYKEGEVLGNIKIDTYVPNSYIEFREVDTNNAKAINLK